jgi:hypothetical protein
MPLPLPHAGHVSMYLGPMMKHSRQVFQSRPLVIFSPPRPVGFACLLVYGRVIHPS